MVPNIFRYATKELSQDAFICWLVACAKEAKGKLRECGLSFVEALMRSGERRVIDARTGAEEGYDGEGVAGRCPRRPVSAARWNRRVLPGEGGRKRGEFCGGGQDWDGNARRTARTLPHGRREDADREDLIKAVYFKTGYVFDDERELAERAGYCVFDAEEVVTFFAENSRIAPHAFVRDFAEHVGGSSSEGDRCWQSGTSTKGTCSGSS